MISIKEAAIQHCNRSQFKSDFPHDYHSEESGFKAGVEFAQRWIPVEEESPAEYDYVLAKSSVGDVYVACYSLNKFHTGMPHRVIITHWRPIEYK